MLATKKYSPVHYRFSVIRKKSTIFGNILVVLLNDSLPDMIVPATALVKVAMVA